jgi:hypothetical protein
MKNFILFLSLFILSGQSGFSCLSTMRVPSEIIEAGGFRSSKNLGLEAAEWAINIHRDIKKNWRYRDVKNNETHSIISDEWDISSFYSEQCKSSLLTLQYKGGNSVDAYCNALNNLPKTQFVTECTLSSQVWQILVFKNLMGNTCFKTHLSNVLKLKNHLDNGLYSVKLLTTLAGDFDFKRVNNCFQYVDTYVVGSFVYITNIPDYLQFEKKGLYRGENVVCVGDNQFIGVGDFYKKGSKTQEEIRDNFYNELKNNKKFGDKYKDKKTFLSAISEAQSKRSPMGFRIDYKFINESISQEISSKDNN